MNHTRRLFCGLTLMLMMVTGCAVSPPVPEQPPTTANETDTSLAAVVEQIPAPETNLTSGCVENYVPEVDYFPEKTQPDFATGWVVEYHNHYKVLTLLNPWSGAEETFQYVLVQCGTPRPDGFADALMVDVPVQQVAALTSTELPHLHTLNLLDRLVAVEEFDYVNTPAVRTLIDKGMVQEVGGGANVDTELLIDLSPDLVVTFAYGNADYDAHPKLLEAGLPVALNAGYMETSPLGRSEWLKVTSLFFNAEAAANVAFDSIAAEYAKMAALVDAVDTLPTVLVGIARGDGWRVPGGQSYFARYVADAGGAYLWAEDDATGSLPLDFEVVYDQALDADFWLPNTGGWSTLDDVIAADARYGDFAAVANGTVYNNNANLNQWGGNDYWETGVANPHLVLADLIHIFHPDLLPDHDSIWFRQLEPQE